MSSRPKKIFLHVDVNKTVLMSDKSTGRDTEGTANSILTWVTWGILENLERITQFREQYAKMFIEERCSPAPTEQEKKEISDICACWIPVESDQLKSSHSHTSAVKFGDFLETYLFPYPCPKDKYPKDKVARVNGLVRKRRQWIQNNFALNGFPGERWNELIGTMTSMLQLPGSPNEVVKIVPSFYALIQHLHLEKTDYDVRVIFRTFGPDLPEIIPEYQMKTNRKVDSMGVFFRNGHTIEESHLILGTDKTPSLHQDMTFYEQLKKENPNIIPLSGFHMIHEYLSTVNCDAGLQDYYPWWSANNEKASSGKLFIVDPDDPDIFQIFFDDNIDHEQADKNIVDLRHLKTGQPLSIDKYLGVHLIQVEPFRAILEEDYFVKTFQGAFGKWEASFK
jgi:hypothetical protein